MICEKQDGLIHNKDIYRKINILCKVGKLELHFVSENLVLSKQSNINTLLHLGLVVEYAKRLVSWY